MSTTYYTDDRLTLCNQLAYSRFAAPGKTLGKLARAIGVKWTALTNVKILSMLDDHQLDDIGLPRSEIRPLARKSAEAAAF